VVAGARLVAHGGVATLGLRFLFYVCGPGQEDAAFERMRQLIAASVPEYQLPPATIDG